LGQSRVSIRHLEHVVLQQEIADEHQEAVQRRRLKRFVNKQMLQCGRFLPRFE
jgi:hypothetical protein